MTTQQINWVYTEPDPAQIQIAMGEFNVPEIYARVLVARGIIYRTDGTSFFNAGHVHTNDPFLMKGMDQAVELILKEIKAGHPILIFGDYDVDGTTAASMLYLVLIELGAKPSTYIPNRETDGYGLSAKGIDYAELIGASLMITCDCGINAVEMVDYAHAKNIQVIITDHHVPDRELPGAEAILNPKQVDCPYPFKGLCGGGVAFKLALALAERSGYDRNLVWQHADLVALGTAADIVPIIDENRVIVKEGLKLMRERSKPGLAALWQVSGMAGKDMTVGRLVFGLAPKINAAGRLGDAGRSVKLLTTENHYFAVTMARELVAENERRRRIQEQTVEDAIFQVNAQHDLTREKVLVLHSEKWHAGVIGIVAARIRDLFHRPTAIIAFHDGVGKGSLRSMADFDLYAALSACRSELAGFGGHTVAAGLTVERDNLKAFAKKFNAWADLKLTFEQLIPRQIVDGDCPLELIDGRFIRFLNSLEPYGPGNRRPVFVSRGVDVIGTPRLVGDGADHIKFKVSQGSKSFDVIGFGQAHHYEKLIVGKPVDIAYIVEENSWQGNRQVQLQVKDIKLGESV
ncbi:single-stranded-DNA-specific exonuclease RecJ [Candidatus Neomarinimicrobiota bacterium]